MTACLAVLLGGGGAGGDDDDDDDDANNNNQSTVTGKEHMPELVAASLRSLDRLPRCRRMRRAGRLRVVEGDGRDCECAETKGRQFDLVHCGAAVEAVPDEMLRLLRPGRSHCLFVCLFGLWALCV